MKKVNKIQLYGIESYSQDQLMKMKESIFKYAEAINGLPKNHMEVLEKGGWLLPFLYGYDDLLWNRWSYWFALIEKGTIQDSSPIPQITWETPGSLGYESTSKMLATCLNHYEAKIDNFAQWLQWGLALTKEKPNVSEKLNEYYYRNFDIFLLQKYPSDYMSHVLCEATGKGYKSGIGYFPTPFSVFSLLITQMTYKELNSPIAREQYKKQTVYDGCVGCGSLFLPASNYSLRGYAQDINKTALDLLKIQCMLYAPWFAFPFDLKGFSEEQVEVRPASNNNGIEGQLELVI
jgi:hypothetical protein